MTRIKRALGLTTLLLMPALQAVAQEPEAAPETGPPPAVVQPPAASAGPAAPFGAEGRIAVSIDLPFMNEGPQLAVVRQSISMGGSSTTVVAIRPSLDYFVAPSISVGGQVGIQYISNSSGFGANTTIGVEARAGYNVGLADSVSLWPRLGVGYDHVSGNGGQNAYDVTLTVSVPVLWHPGSHFFLGAGPALSTQLVNKINGANQGKLTDIGLTALIGGYFGGA